MYPFFGGVTVRKPRFGGKLPQKLLESPRELNEHLRVQLPMLISQGHENSETPDHHCSRLSKLCQYVGEHFASILLCTRSSWCKAFMSKERLRSNPVGVIDPSLTPRSRPNKDALGDLFLYVV